MRVTGPSSYKDDEGWSDGAQGSSSGHPQECKRPGVPGGGSAADRMLWIDGKALGPTNGRLGGGAAGREGQSLAGNCALGPGEVDSKGVAEGVWFHERRRNMASRTDRFIDGKFSGRCNPKDGYTVVDCKEPRARKIFEFLVPLLYPEKPTRVTITVGNTIFGALSGERLVDWGW